MAMQKIEFEFPDDDDDAKFEVESNKMETIDLKNPKSHLEKDDEPEAKKPAKEKADDELDLEIVDDTPEADKGRKPSDPPEDPTDEELENYSDKVRNRIKHFTKGYHDERRAKEAATRERDEAQRVLGQMFEENKKLKETGNKSQTALLAQAKASAEQAHKAAQAEYKKAYNDGDADKVLAAQERLSDTKNRVERLANYKLPALQTDEASVNSNTNTSEPVNTQPQQTQVQTDEKAANWAKENQWFQTDTEMTGFALGLHNKLVNDGMDPQSDKYYETINARMRKVFPERFDGEEPKRQTSDNVVAPASRSTTPKKVRLTQTQVRLAKRLGLTPEQYAKQVALEMRKNTNG